MGPVVLRRRCAGPRRRPRCARGDIRRAIAIPRRIACKITRRAHEKVKGRTERVLAGPLRTTGLGALGRRPRPRNRVVQIGPQGRRRSHRGQPGGTRRGVPQCRPRLRSRRRPRSTRRPVPRHPHKGPLRVCRATARIPLLAPIPSRASFEASSKSVSRRPQSSYVRPRAPPGDPQTSRTRSRPATLRAAAGRSWRARRDRHR